MHLLYMVWETIFPSHPVWMMWHYLWHYVFISSSSNMHIIIWETPQKCHFTLGFCMLNFSIVPGVCRQECIAAI